MTKKQTDEVIIEYYKSGMGKGDIAKAVQAGTRYVCRVIDAYVYQEEKIREFKARWDAVRNLCKPKPKKVVEEDTNRVVFVRVNARAGYWWQLGFDYSRSVGGIEEGRGREAEDGRVCQGTQDTGAETGGHVFQTGYHFGCDTASY